MSKDYEAIKIEYLQKAKLAKKHPAKLIVLRYLLKEIFEIEDVELLSGIEFYLKSSIRTEKGSVDLLFPGVVIELKLDLKKELDVGLVEIHKYFTLLNDKYPGKKFIAILTDLFEYKAYAPHFEGEDISVVEISSISAQNSAIDDFIIWMDSYLFTKTGVIPTANVLKITFGIKSPHYVLLKDELEILWNKIKQKSEIILKYNLWAKHMQLVYGKAPGIEAFLSHTYLVTLIKILVYLTLSQIKIPEKEDVDDVLSGQYFVNAGISNLIEDDFFGWLLDEDIIEDTKEIGFNLAKALLKFDLTKVDEDLFKEIYQELVELGERHRLGEYYTPEWLSDLIVRRVYGLWEKKNINQIPKILDPGCGSGTFLTNAIKLFKEKLLGKEKDKEILKIILNNIFGFDINPLAVITAKANYIITLGQLILGATLTSSISIPIFNADSVKVPEIRYSLTSMIPVIEYQITINSDSTGTKIPRVLEIPLRVAMNSKIFSEIINCYRKSLGIFEEHNAQAAQAYFTRKINGKVDSNEKQILNSTLDSLISLSRNKQNSIWLFMLSNFFIPTLYREKDLFDILIGNPPWIVMRSFESKEYKEFLKNQIFEYELLPRKEIKNYSNMEMASYFQCRTIDLYLKNDGLSAYLLPISTIGASKQHVCFREFKKPKTRLIEIHNFEGVNPIFSLPVCCLITKKGKATKYPVNEFYYNANLSVFSKNEKLEKIRPILKTTKQKYEPPLIPDLESHYYKQAVSGVSLFPRNFWYIEFKLSTKMPIYLTKPSVITSSSILKSSKDEWKDKIDGSIENKFIFSTLLGKDIVPFGYVDYRKVILPLEITNLNTYRLLFIAEAKHRGLISLYNWLKKVETLWKEKRTQKSVKNFPSALDRINYHNLLTNISPLTKYFVVWNARGANSFCNIIDTNNLPSFEVRGAEINPIAFIPDYTLYYVPVMDEKKAEYLCAIINSPIVHKAVKPFQPKGLYGHRDIGRLMFKLPIPKFDKDISEHLELCKLTRKCKKIVVNEEFEETDGFKKRRNALAKVLVDELNSIDEIVKQIGISKAEK